MVVTMVMLTLSVRMMTKEDEDDDDDDDDDDGFHITVIIIIIVIIMRLLRSWDRDIGARVSAARRELVIYPSQKKAAAGLSKSSSLPNW